MNARATEDVQPPLATLVITTCLGDRLEYLKTAVASALGQTYERFEVVLVVDGAVKDATALFLRALAVRDDRVRCVWLPENRGPGAARNAGVAASRGTYVAFLDADDMALPERIARQVAFLEETGADLAGSWYRIVDAAGGFLEHREMPTGPAWVRRLMPILNPIGNSTVMARRDTLLRWPFPEQLRFGEDYWLWVELALKGCALRNLPAYLVDYRRDEGFLARRTGWSRFRADLRVRLHALELWPRWFVPFGIGAAFGVSGTRLMPRRVLGMLYGIRGKLRFSR